MTLIITIKFIKNTNKIMNLKIIVISLTAGILLLAGYIWSQNTLKLSPEPVFCTQDAMQCPDGSYVGRTGPKCEFAACPKSPSTSLGTILDTSDWKTYRNEKYGFEIKYPEDWVTKPYSILNTQSIEVASFSKPRSYESRVEDIIIFYFDNIKDLPNNSNGVDLLAYLNTREIVTNVKKIFLANQDAFSFSESGLDSNYAILLEKGGKIYEIWFGYKGSETNLDKIEHQILSTFKFIE